MRTRDFIWLSSVACLIAPVSAFAQTAVDPAVAPTAEEASAGDIIVTAQKRSQRLNDIGMTITAASGNELTTRGVTDTSDLGKIVAGFRSAPTNNLTPIYTLRGVGLYDSALGSSPTVTVYVDEVPLGFPVMTRAASLDLERVEVLKGPQGTLFGQNSTGGAINYVAAKPTAELEAGLDLTYARFGKIDARGFVSGPLSDTLRARLAVRAIEGGAYQYSLTRPDDRLGASREIQGRLLLDFTPTDRLKFVVNLTASRDNSDTIAPQTVSINPVVPALAAPGLIGSPIAPNDPRAADWTPQFSDRSKDRFYQGALRAQYDLTDSLSLISITNFAHQKVDKMVEQDSSAAYETQVQAYGTIDAFNQELRLTGSSSRTNWIIGASYDHNKIDDNFRYLLPFNSTNQPLPTLPRFEEVTASAKQTVDTYAIFANIEQKLTDSLSVHLGARYTDDDRKGTQCSFDPTTAQLLTDQFNGLQQLFALLGAKTSPYVPSQARDCLQFLPDLTPTNAPFPVRIHENNLSWRGGIDYKTDGGTLFYLSVSRGYKAGVISPSAAINTLSNQPVKQERVDAYEIGFKAPLFDRALQVNAAGFYYDYKDKQIRARFFDPIFALLERLENVPKSRVFGAEVELTARPVEGLNISAAATYLNAKINGDYFTVNAQGEPADNIFTGGNFRGSRLPYTPRLSIVSDAQYQWPINGSIDAFVGGSVTYNSKTQTTFITDAFPGQNYIMPAYTLLDLRAGIAAQDGSWRVQVFGRNVTNKFYVTNIADANDARYRYAGMPATYGLTLTLRTR